MINATLKKLYALPFAGRKRITSSRNGKGCILDNETKAMKTED